MLHQTIPLYEGNLPFFYACYSEDDDALAFPILVRMYNEGFRLWSARAGGVATADFRTMQRLGSSSCVVLFMSRVMLDLIRRGDPEVLAVIKSPLLHVVVALDDCEFDNSIFALSSPDCIRYHKGSDSPFWLYIYSSDPLERCRGPWPSKKLSTREETLDEIAPSTVDAEYRALETIMRGEKKEEKPAEEPAAPKDDRIPSEPDDMNYIPLGKVKAAKSRAELEYDDLMDMIDNAVNRQSQIIEAHSGALPKPSRGSIGAAPEAVVDWDAKWYSDTPLPPPTQEELDAYDDKFPEPEVVAKADRTVTPGEAKKEDEPKDDAKKEDSSAPEAPNADAQNAQPTQSAQNAQNAQPVMITLPAGGAFPTVPGMTGAGAGVAPTIVYVPIAPLGLGADGQVTYMPIGMPQPQIQPAAATAAAAPAPEAAAPSAPAETEAAADPAAPAEPSAEAEPTADAAPEAVIFTGPAEGLPPEPAPLVFESIHGGLSDLRQNLVSVMVRRQPSSVVRVTPVARRIVRPVVNEPASTPMHLRMPRRQSEPAGVLPPSISNSVEFEEYVRDIALSAISVDQPAAEEFIASARKFSGKPVVTAPLNGAMPAMPAMSELSGYTLPSSAQAPADAEAQPAVSHRVSPRSQAQASAAQQQPTAPVVHEASQISPVTNFVPSSYAPAASSASAASAAQTAPADGTAAEGENGEVVSQRKNRHPHKRGLLASLMHRIRHGEGENAEEGAEPAEGAENAAADPAENAAALAPVTAAEPERETPEINADGTAVVVKPVAVAPEEPEDGATHLSRAIRRFSERNVSEPASVQVVPRVKK